MSKKGLTILLISNIIVVPRCKGSEKLLELIKTEGFKNIYEVEQFEKSLEKLPRRINDIMIGFSLSLLCSKKKVWKH